MVAEKTLLNKRLEDFNDDKRLNDILEMIGRVAGLDFSQVLDTSDRHDMIDAIAVGLNMLSEELRTNVVEKSKLDSVNSRLEKFAYTTAHDLKSPLNSINGLVHLLELTLNIPQDSEAHQYISTLKKTTHQMKQMVEGILNYSKAGSPEALQEVIDLNCLVNRIIESDLFAELADIQFKTALPTVWFNNSAMEQVFRNLLSNAVKYCDKSNCQIIIECLEKDEHYEIRVHDNGPGIAPEYHQKIFELFKSIGVDTNSHGIGLTTVKSILESCGERIWITSQLGDGATFHFTIKKQKNVQANSNFNVPRNKEDQVLLRL